MSDSAEGGLGLVLDDATPLVLNGDTAWTRGDVRRHSDALRETFPGNGPARIMVRSDDPVELLATIDACSRTGSDLWVAHTNLQDAVVEELMSRFAIEFMVGRGRVDAPAATAPAGRLHVMTSGTTGTPKVAVHSLQSLMGRIRAEGGRSLNRGARWLLTYQPTAFAGIQVMLTAVASNGIVVPPEPGGIMGMFEAARRHGVTHASGTPTFWRGLMLIAQPGSLPLRQITLGGEGVDQATLDRVRQTFPDAHTTHIYASTEAGVIFAVHDGLEGFPAEWLDSDVHGVQVRVRDGVVEVRTPHRMASYASGQPDPLTEDGWLVTADMAVVEGNRVRILGREDAVINVGGAKVHPHALEAFLLTIDGVAEAKVSGVRNPITGWLVAADIVGVPGLEPNEVRMRVGARCREHLPSYQVPRIVNIVERIETGASGKKG